MTLRTYERIVSMADDIKDITDHIDDNNNNNKDWGQILVLIDALQIKVDKIKYDVADNNSSPGIDRFLNSLSILDNVISDVQDTCHTLINNG